MQSSLLPTLNCESQKTCPSESMPVPKWRHSLTLSLSLSLSLTHTHTHTKVNLYLCCLNLSHIFLYRNTTLLSKHWVIIIFVVFSQPARLSESMHCNMIQNKQNSLSGLKDNLNQSEFVFFSEVSVLIFRLMMPSASKIILFHNVEVKLAYRCNSPKIK